MQELKPSPDWFQGAVSFEYGDGWLKPWRLPFDHLAVYAPIPDLADRAAMPAGVRIHLRGEATKLELGIVPDDQPRPFDLCVNDRLIRTVLAGAGHDRVDFEELPEGEKTVDIWLPHVQPVALTALRAEAASELELPSDTRPRWIHYGSSISHCGTAHSPARTWPAIVARERRLHLTCLGFGGNCHLDPMIARVIGNRPASFISLKVGINIYGAASLSPRTFRPALIGFLRTIRDSHPKVPIALISAIASPPREAAPNPVGFTLQQMRAEVRDVAARLTADGDERIWYVDGLRLFGPELHPHLPDDLHPSGEGYEILARNFQHVVLDQAPFRLTGKPS